MYIQIVNFHLRDLSCADYRALCDGLAPAFAEVPGLLSKVWLANPTTNTYGGVYAWTGREAMEEFSKSELFGAVVSNPHLAEITSVDFDVLDAPTSVTRGLAEVPA